MSDGAWKTLLRGRPWFRRPGGYPIAAYSEFMPPPRLGPKPYGTADERFLADAGSDGWPVTEYEEALELRPGLEHLAGELVTAFEHLGQGRPAHGFARAKLADNPCWPAELAEHAGRLAHERYVVLAPLALSRTQDDKGRVRWTLFGGSEQGPARPFWRGLFTPGGAAAEEQALGFLRRLLQAVYGEQADLRAAGFRVLPQDGEPEFPFWREDPWPDWVTPLLLGPRQPLRGVKYLLAFQPFARLPAAVRRAYLAGELHLLPFPGSLLFWHAPPYLALQHELPLAMQIPLLQSIPRHEGPGGLRVPQSGWLHEPRHTGADAATHHGPVRNTYRRTHRWAKVHRDEDELAIEARPEKLLHVLFSAAADDVGLYGKPMARNVQLWTRDNRLLLDGPNADGRAVKAAEHRVLEEELVGYRFQYPAMRVGPHEVYWHRPLVAYLSAETRLAAVVPDAPLGYVTAYRADRPDPAKPVELWPRLLRREGHAEALTLFEHTHDSRPHQTVRNVRKVLDTAPYFPDGRAPRTLVRRMLNVPREETLDQWLASLPGRAADADAGARLADLLRGRLEPADAAVPEALTFGHTSRRSFEVAYWKAITRLAEGRYVNKDNADCVRDAATTACIPHHARDLEALGDYLLDYYQRLFGVTGMAGKARVGELPFQWRTDFDFPWSGGWLANQEGRTYERDIVAVIPGRDRGRAVIMADHYDTAYMADRYEKESGGNGARLAACGADDNHSATAALMLGAPAFLRLSRERRLDCDVWLIHLTGEEFPADCMGARALCERLVEGDLGLRLPGGGKHDLSGTRVQGVYVLDMVAHNNDHARDIFQLSPGTGRESMWLAYQAHLANEVWNRSVEAWDRRPPRRGAGRGRRSPHGGFIPAVAEHPRLAGEVRMPYDPRSTLYNTDGQIFSDAGVPVVLFMENYDINRTGYHDTHDTMANIDLDYGAAVAAIAIESVARAATERPVFEPAPTRATRRSK